jgi:hypothetical protein
VGFIVWIGEEYRVRGEEMDEEEGEKRGRKVWRR